MGSASRRIAELVARLARRRELRLRRSLAEALERAVAEVDEPLRRDGTAVAIDRPAVAEAAPMLLGVVDRLRAPWPLAPDAMRLVRSLLGDGAGPLYARSARRSEHPPGTLLARFTRVILVVCDDRVPQRDPGERVRS